MKFLRAFTIFCEYLRMEIGGPDTLLGVFPGNINLPKPPPEIELIGVPIHTYTKVEFSTLDGMPEYCSLTLRYNGADLFNNIVERQLLIREFSGAKEQGLEKAAIILRTQGQGLPIPTVSGKLQSLLTIDGEEALIGETLLSFIDI